jgi:hypothetical protein
MRALKILGVLVLAAAGNAMRLWFYRQIRK